MTDQPNGEVPLASTMLSAAACAMAMHMPHATPHLGVCRMRLFDELVFGAVFLLEKGKQNQDNLISKLAVPVSENPVFSGMPQGGGEAVLLVLFPKRK